jgi:hypothetical protein
MLGWLGSSAGDGGRDLHSVLDHGAKGDGIADDTGAIQATIDAAQVAGGTVLLPAGTYRITDTLRVVGRSVAPFTNSRLPVVVRGSGATMPYPLLGPATPITRVVWSGARGGSMLWLRLLNGGGLSDLVLDGAGLAATGVRLEASQAQLWSSVTVEHTAAGSASDAAFVFHGGARPHQRPVGFCVLQNLNATDVAKGVLMTSGDADTDVDMCAFLGLWVLFTGAYGLRIEAGDNNDIIGCYLNRLSGTGDAVQLADAGGVLFGARYNYFYHLNGGAQHGAAAVAVETSYVNTVYGYDQSNGLPDPTGSHRRNLLILGGSGGMVGARQLVLMNGTNAFGVGFTAIPTYDRNVRWPDYDGTALVLGGNLQAARAQIGQVPAGASVLVTVAWPAGFQSLDYTAVVSVAEGIVAGPSLRVLKIESQSRTAIAVRVQNDAGSPRAGTLHAIAVLA